MNDYGTEVKLLAVTRLPISSPVPSGSGTDGQSLIEYASRLCVAREGETREGYIEDRIAQGHESVLEHASATFYIRASRVLTHELVRHRIASYSQRSQRYVNESKPRYITPPELSLQASVYFKTVMDTAWDAYKDLLKNGYSREIARYVLPNACETQIVMTMNFRELRHFIKLRTSPRALPEMREVAGKVKDICMDLAPQVFRGLNENNKQVKGSRSG